MIPELKCGLPSETQLKLQQIFARHKKVTKVILYGSRAKGNFKPGSDIDLTIQSATMTLSDLLRIENEIEELLLPHKVDLSFFQQIENVELIAHIERVGIVFYP